MFEQVIEEGKRRLKKEPFDAGHDIDHHLAVVLNCVSIIGREKLNLDTGSLAALQMAAWWHDYKRGEESENDKILTGTMQKWGFGSDAISQVLSIKNSHSYGNNQESQEAQVLFDADKLEYVSTRRYRRIAIAVANGEMSPETFAKYKRTFRERIGNIRDQLHFETSKKMFDKRLQEVATYIKEPKHILWSDLFEVV